MNLRLLPHNLTLCVALSACAVPSILAQGKIVDKNYPVHGQATLDLHADDADIRASSCVSCSSLHVHVDYRDADPSRYNLIESQSGNDVSFQLKRKPMSGWSAHWSHGPEITVEVPSETNDRLATGSGNVTLRGVRGQQELHSGSGNLETAETAGSLRMDTGSGNIRTHAAHGDFEARTGSGDLQADGILNLHRAATGSGGIQLTLAQGSNIDSNAVIQTGSGDVVLRMSPSTRADLQVNTGSGDIHCDFPIANSTHNDHNLSGTINGGGPSLRIRTGSGSVSLRSI